MFKFYIIFLLLILQSLTLAQIQRVTINGFISDLQSGEALIGVNILIYKDTSRTGDPLYFGTTNKFGYYSISNIIPGKYFLFSSLLGYERKMEQLDADGSVNPFRLDIKLQKKAIQLGEVVVEDKRKTDFSSTSGTVEVEPEIVRQLPSIGGETDLFKVLQLLPGVSNASEISTGIYVRGGSADQTLTLIDGVVVYNPSHLGGFSSTFDPESIQNIKLIKGAFPAEYGGRLSSVLDISLREGTREKFKGLANITSISSRITLEGPLSEKATYIMSARMMYLDKILPVFPKASRFPKYNFKDFNGKLNYQISETDKIFISGFFSNDQILEPPASTDVGFDINWSNSTLNLTWTKINSPELFSTTSLKYTYYNFNTAIQDKDPEDKALDFYTSSKLADFQLKTEFQLSQSGKHFIKAGAEIIYHNFDILKSDFYNQDIKYSQQPGETYRALEASVYLQDEMTLFTDLRANAGARLHYFKEANFFAIEPRLSLTYYIFDRLIARASFAIAHQALHLLTRSDVYLPTDVWFPSAKNVEPAESMQGSLGFEATSVDRTFLFTVEAYYKELKKLKEYKENADFSIESVFSDQLTEGSGEAYGAEFFLNKRAGNFSGWIGYTVSWTKRTFADLNRGETFFPRYDRRHDVSIVLTWQPSEALSLGATWNYSTGQAYALPLMQYSFFSLVNPNSSAQKTYYEYSQRDAFRLPPFHKLDVSARYKTTWDDRDIEISLTIYNAYNRNNAFSKYVGYKVDEASGEKVPVLKQFTLFPFLPSLGIRVSF